MIYAERPIEDYAERREQQMKWWRENNGKQPGDPAKVAQALIRIASAQRPPTRFIAGADAVVLAKQKAADFQTEIDSQPELSATLDYDKAQR
jgi:hypothetical protein